jgi:flagellar basal-body rod modification protein FlgD
MQINNAIYNTPDNNGPDNSVNNNTPNSNDGKTISDMFTTLLVAQIQNQDPLAPMEASQFVTQFAQLSQVEAMQSMASLTAAAAALQESMLVVTLGSQVGSQVMVAADSVKLDGDVIKGGFALENNASEVTLILTGPDGTEHKIDLGSRDAGEVNFEIDPEELGLPPGKYAMRVSTNTSETPRTEIQGELESVRLGADGRVILMVAGIGEISTGDITRFLGRPNNATYV